MIPGSLAVIFMVLPVLGLVVQAPWGSFGTLLTDPVTRDALRISAVSSLWATAICIVLGTPLAWLLARNALPGTRFIRALVVVPLLLPPVVAGVGLLTAFGRRGFVGSFLYDQFGIQFPFTTAGVVLAQAFVAMPFLIIAVRPCSNRYDTGCFAFTWFEQEVKHATRDKVIAVTRNEHLMGQILRNFIKISKLFL